ncbi:MAG: hypothetical protein ACE5Q3_01955 [Alphaproteobacteria bacterium]
MLAAIAIAVTLALGLFVAPQQIRTDHPARGHALAERWCADCHRVSPRQEATRYAGAPSFMAVAARPEVDADYLTRFMAEVHVQMPTYRLFPDEQKDVMIYLLSLRSSEAAAEEQRGTH